MATKKFIIEVDEGRTECEMCPYMSIKGLGCSSVQVLNCTMYNLATMKIKELKITLEIEQRRGKCEDCPLFKFKGFGCSTALPINCTKYDLSTIKIQDNENQD